MIFVLIFFVILLLPLLYVMMVYNSLQRSKVRTEETWSGIGTALQQRNDLIPNLVEVVKGYAKHESSTLAEVTRWRNLSTTSATPHQQSEAQAGLHKALTGILAVAEQYPDLKADAVFRQLQDKLGTLEDEIRNARMQYNSSVRAFNASLKVFPNNMISGFFSIRPIEFFEATEAASTQVPQVKFS